MGYLPLPQHWRTSDGSAARGGSEDHEFTTRPEALELQPFETLIVHAKATPSPWTRCAPTAAPRSQRPDSSRTAASARAWTRTGAGCSPKWMSEESRDVPP